MENNNTIDMQNESLEDFAERYSNERGHPVNTKDILKHGANWQQQKDKTVIEQAFHLLQWAHKVITANVPKQAGYGAIEILPEIEQLLNQLK